jgi:phosphatidate cytidylyltransferase
MALGNLASRLLVAGLLGPFILLAMYQDRPEYFWAIIFAGSLVGMYEFFSMTIEDKTDRLVSLLFGAAAVASFYWLGGGRDGEMLAFFTAVVPVALYYVFRFGDQHSVAMRFTSSVTGIIYAGFLLTFLALIKRDFGSEGGDMVLFVLFLAWMGDTSAYFSGRFLGKRKLYPAVSPGKTWAGAIGGLVGAAGAAILAKVFLIDSLLWVDTLLRAIPGAALGQLGDLTESLLKRSNKVKDSGTILGGHGGILDRVDALIFIAPYVYLYMRFSPQIRALF